MKRIACALIVLVLTVVVLAGAVKVFRNRNTQPTVRTSPSETGAKADPKDIESNTFNEESTKRDDRPRERVTPEIEEIYRDILKALEDDDGNESWLAELETQLLDALGDDPVGCLLLRLKGRTNEEVAICILESLVSISDVNDNRAVLAHLLGKGPGSPSPLNPDVARELLTLATSGSERPLFRAAILDKLASRFRYDSAAFSLVQNSFLSEPSSVVKASALNLMATCINQIPPADAKTVLSYARMSLADQDDRVRAMAASVLSEDPNAVDWLITSFSNERSTVARYAMVEALIALGQNPQPSGSMDAQIRLSKFVIEAAGDADARLCDLALRKVGLLATDATAGESHQLLIDAFGKAEGTRKRQVIIDSLYSLANRGYFRVQIRKELVQYSSDMSLPEEIRSLSSAQAQKLD